MVSKPILLGGLSLLVAACSAAEAPVSEPRPVDWIEVGKASTGSNSSGVYPGRVQARKSTLVSFEVDGRISRMPFEIGDAFPRGATLASVDRSVYRMRMSEASAQLAETEARASEALLNLERQQGLFERKAASQAELQRAQATADSLKGLANANRARVGLAREALSDTSIRAPFAGRIARRMVEPGAQVMPGEPVLEIDGISLEVTFTVSADTRDTLKVGDPVTIFVRNGETKEVPGSIAELSSRAAGAGAFEVIAHIPSTFENVRPGSVVDVRLERSLGDEGAGSEILIPITAFKPGEPNRGDVMVIDPETNKAQARAVKLGRMAGEFIVVTDGLKSGDIIIKRGLAFVSEGEPVARIGSGAERYAK